ncbi:MAG: hypothetical protein FIA93_02335 [Deltaproteobacteria bacterium]|nr:hypothetical protein [Deltaproteobacteria bacterium]PWB64090.1 MAG: hypothetical protein C3F14_07240 [Deltaproteobacteria bacterium]
MKKAVRIPVVLLAALGLLFAVAATAALAAEEAPGGPGPAAGKQYKQMYDPKTVETVSGEVVQVNRIPHRRGRGTGVHLILKTDKEEIPVHLGPSWYLDKLEVKIDRNDKVEVKGSRVTFKGKPVLIAAEVKKGGALLTLRDENGVAAWRRR